MSENLLQVYLNNEHVGNLRQNAGGNLSFQYVPGCKQQISINMPVRVEAYNRKDCFHFFNGLLPESEAARSAIAKKFGATNANNPFSMLRAIGQDCAGAISFYGVGKRANYDQAGEIECLSDERLAELIEDLPSSPLFSGVEGLRISLAGIQEKAAVIVDESGRIFLPSGQPSTHILKPAIKDFSDSALNEFLTMTLAYKIGLSVAEVSLRSAKGRAYLLVKRYDREYSAGKVTRKHQEDFCQALNIAVSNKYEEDGGPSLQDCFKLMEKTMIPAINKLSLLDIVVFNFLVGNVDAHGKNFSLIHTQQNKTLLAPLYDCLCLTMVPSHTRKMAMKIGTEYELAQIRKLEWEKQGEKIGIKLPAILDVIDRMSERILYCLSEQKKSSDYEVAWIEEVQNNCLRARMVLDLG